MLFMSRSSKRTSQRCVTTAVLVQTRTQSLCTGSCAPNQACFEPSTVQFGCNKSFDTRSSAGFFVIIFASQSFKVKNRGLAMAILGEVPGGEIGAVFPRSAP